MKKLLGVLCCLLLFSCKDKFENPITDDEARAHRYFPLSPGMYRVYEVDSIIHETADDKTNNPDSLKTYYHYQIKDQIDSSFIDGEQQTAWYISRYKRSNDSLPWQFLNVWTAKLNQNSAQTVEDNVRYIKLSFPIFKGKTWNGNAYNTIPEETYLYSEINSPINIGGFNFDSSLTVLQNKNFILIYEILKEEKYVSGVGMVYKENDSLNLSGSDTTNGFEYRMVLKDYFPK